MLSKTEFEQICEEIRADREKIIEHNPIGTPEEILLWMLLSVLISYLSLDESETPCFTGRPDASTYRDAVRFVLRNRMIEQFDSDAVIDRMLSK